MKEMRFSYQMRIHTKKGNDDDEANGEKRGGWR
jgi:hypothetical protein